MDLCLMAGLSRGWIVLCLVTGCGFCARDYCEFHVCLSQDTKEAT